jgi:hypothetical protein
MQFSSRPTVSGIGVLLQNEDSLFSGNRGIKRLPTLNLNVGGSNVVEFLNNLFFPFVSGTVGLTAFQIQTYGINSLSQINFSIPITLNDNTITGVAALENNIISKTQTVNTTTNTTISVADAPLATTITATTAANYKARAFFQRDGVDTPLDSSTQRIRFEPPYYYGVTGIADLGNEITGLTRVLPSTYLSINGSNHGINSKPSFIFFNNSNPQIGLPFTISSPGYFYFAYPSFTSIPDSISDWGPLDSNVGVLETTSLSNYTSQFLNNSSTATITFPHKANLVYRVYKSDLINPTETTTFNLRFKFQ